jgi:hypothetical protein
MIFHGSDTSLIVVMHTMSKSSGVTATRPRYVTRRRSSIELLYEWTVLKMPEIKRLSRNSLFFWCPKELFFLTRYQNHP